ncbi:MAG: SIS domain-containing protein [Spartobacteria bacterium]|nr:SIS domain-containing protein [Spartobacteria bacterium]
MSYFETYVNDLYGTLQRVEVTEKGMRVATERGFDRWQEITCKLTEQKRTMYFIGNGASATMASHMAADANKNGGFRSDVFNDVALMTAIANDVAYDQCFALPLRRLGNAGDVLIAISSSGNSPNVVNAVTAARDMGIITVTLTGMSSDNQLRQLGDLNVYLPASTYGQVEAGHQVILHTWLDYYMSDDKKRSGWQ